MYDRLSARFGHENVFMDVLLPAGEDFVAKIEEAVGSCDVLIALIGRQWLDVRTAAGRRRLEEPGDFPRIEIQAALQRRVPVLPLLVEGAKMPGPDELPDGLDPLARRQAHELSDTRWDYDMDRLIERIGGLTGEQPAVPAAAKPPSGGRRPFPSMAAAAVLAALVAVAAFAILSGGGDRPPQQTVSRAELAAYRTEVGKVCDRRDALQAAKKRRFRRYARKLTSASTFVAQRNAILEETEKRTAAASDLDGALDALDPPATLAESKAATVKAWEDIIRRLRAHRDRLLAAETYDEFLAVLRRLDRRDRSAIERDSGQIDVGLRRMGGAACDLDPSWSDPVLALNRPKRAGAGAVLGSASASGSAQRTPSSSGRKDKAPAAPSPNPTPNASPAEPLNTGDTGDSYSGDPPTAIEAPPNPTPPSRAPRGPTQEDAGATP